MLKRNGTKKSVISLLTESYDLLLEVMESPGRIGYLAIITKAKPECRAPISAKLLDFKSEVDNDIHILNTKILRILGMDNLPDGKK